MPSDLNLFRFWKYLRGLERSPNRPAGAKSAAPGGRLTRKGRGRAGRRPVGEKRGPTMQTQPRVGQNQGYDFFPMGGRALARWSPRAFGVSSSFGIRSWTGNEPISGNPSGVPVLYSCTAHGAFKAADLARLYHVFAAVINRAALTGSMTGWVVCHSYFPATPLPCSCSVIHLSASYSVINPLIASVSPSGHKISTPQPDPGFFRATKVGRCSDIPRLCAACRPFATVN
jgi:hypothetical protein